MHRNEAQDRCQKVLLLVPRVGALLSIGLLLAGFLGWLLGTGARFDDERGLAWLLVGLFAGALACLVFPLGLACLWLAWRRGATPGEVRVRLLALFAILPVGAFCLVGLELGSIHRIELRNDSGQRLGEVVIEACGRSVEAGELEPGRSFVWRFLGGRESDIRYRAKLGDLEVMGADGYLVSSFGRSDIEIRLLPGGEWSFGQEPGAAWSFLR